MAIVPLFDPAGIKRQFEAAVARHRQAVTLKVAYVGELCVNHARELDTYKDQTGNLRASIGYVVAYNGVVQKYDFTGAGAGTTIGNALARRLAAEHSRGWVLVVVAGMNYAVEVESRGLDVLTTAEQLAVRILPGMLKSLSVRRT